MYRLVDSSVRTAVRGVVQHDRVEVVKAEVAHVRRTTGGGLREALVVSGASTLVQVQSRGCDTGRWTKGHG